jgi:oligoribonuclease (3'-5' exoribonuclease)
MTGLSIQKDTILEIACVITDENLDVIEKMPGISIYHPNSILDTMSDWCKEHHEKVDRDTRPKMYITTSLFTSMTFLHSLA